VRPRRASERLERIVDSVADISRISMGDLVDRLGPSSFGLLLLLLAILALLPIPGPIGQIFGAALAFVGFQVMRNARRIWLPQRIRAAHLPVPLLVATIRRFVPWLRWVERAMARRRLLVLTSARVRVGLGAAVIVLAAIIAIPIPLGNLLPALAIMSIALALLERDGAVVIVALAMTVAAIAWTIVLFVFGALIVRTLWGFFGG
jgi:hypothetical protein